MTAAPGSGIRTVTADDGVRLHARLDPAAERRAASTLLLVNSLGCDVSMWDGQLDAWRTTHDVLRYDQRGHGRSEVPAGPYDLDRLGRDALAVLDAFGIERADVCGLSLGGLVAQWLCLEVPERVGRVVFADTAARVGTRDAWLERAALVRSEGMAGVTDLVLDRFFSPSVLAAGGPAVGRTRATLAAMAPEGYASCCEALATADLRDRSADIGHHCLVLVGTADLATPPDAARELATPMSRAAYAELDGAGHLSNLEQPGLFARLVHDHLVGPDA